MEQAIRLYHEGQDTEAMDRFMQILVKGTPSETDGRTSVPALGASPETLERFTRRFAPYGFRREAMMPVYGLAENSVALAFPPPGRGHATQRRASHSRLPRPAARHRGVARNSGRGEAPLGVEARPLALLERGSGRRGRTRTRRCPIDESVTRT